MKTNSKKRKKRRAVLYTPSKRVEFFRDGRVRTEETVKTMKTIKSKSNTE